MGIYDEIKSDAQKRGSKLAKPGKIEKIPVEQAKPAEGIIAPAGKPDRALPWQTEPLCWGGICQWADRVDDGTAYPALVCLRAMDRIAALDGCPLGRWKMTAVENSISYIVISPRPQK